jgi:parvulin-like peptidyl-prolyl isomerase
MKSQPLYIFPIVVTACLAVISSPSRADEHHLPAGVVAIVGDKIITAAQFRETLLRADRGEDLLEGKKLLMTEMVHQELLYAAAVREGYGQRPEIREAMRRLVIARYREDMLESLLKRIVVTDKEVADFYREHGAEFSTPAMRRSAVIEIRIPAKATPEHRAELRGRAEKARSEAGAFTPATLSFATVAVNYSDDQASRYRGGEIGWLTREQRNSRWDGVVKEAIFSLDVPGMVSPILTTAEAYYVVKFMEIKKSAPLTLNEVAEQIRRRLNEKKKEQVTDEFYATLRKEVPVTINEQLLAEMELPARKVNSALKPPSLPGQ